MRASFTTEFIYDCTNGYKDRWLKLVEILDADKEHKGGSCLGRITGITRGLDLAEEDIRRWVEEMSYEMSKITIVPFKIVWLLEGGDLLCKEIKPFQKV